MRYRRFGRTQLEVPVFSCGGMRYQQSWTATDAVSDESRRNVEATVDRALELGIHHFETARAYGTSEAQLGRALARHPRERFILQTKASPRADPREFARELEDSFARLGFDRVDLFALHGLNNRERIDQALRPGGCWEVAEELRRRGRIGHIGFSTHAPCPVIVELIETGRFSYVNLHWYAIFQDNLPALQAAKARELGVFIISPSDKGGRLYDPPPKLVELCAPLHPMVFNDLFCLSQPWIDTISLGAARPEDFDRHLETLAHLDDPRPLVEPIARRLDAARREALGDDFAATWWQGIPEWHDIPGGVNVRSIVWLWSLARAFDLVTYARMRYNLLGRDDHWFPGNKAQGYDEAALARSLSDSPHRERILEILRLAHELLDDTAASSAA